MTAYRDISTHTKETYVIVSRAFVQSTKLPLFKCELHHREATVPHNSLPVDEVIKQNKYHACISLLTKKKKEEREEERGGKIRESKMKLLDTFNESFSAWTVRGRYVEMPWAHAKLRGSASWLVPRVNVRESFNRKWLTQWAYHWALLVSRF